MARTKKATTDEMAIELRGPAAAEGVMGGMQARNIIADDAAAAKYDLDMFHVDPANNIGRPGVDAYNDAKFQETKESIRRLGVLQPVLFSMNGGDALDLRIGFRRFEIMRQLRAENPDDPRFLAIPAIPLDGSATALEMLRANLAENVQRQDLSAMGKAHIAHELQASGMTLQSIADEMGFRSKGQVSKLLTLLTLPEALQAQVHEGKLDAEAAYQLSRKPAEVQEAASETLAEGTAADAAEITEAGEVSGTSRKNAKKKTAKKITRKAAKTARVGKGKSASGRKTLATGDKTRSRDDVFNFFSALAKPAKDAEKVKDAVGAIAKAVVGYMDGRVGDKKLAGVLAEQTKGR
jgi:ParB/RepB/Spo0J family partition protein